MIGSDGHIRLTDFGFAKELTEGKTRSFVGTVEYMCPEMILRKDYGKPSDYWSLGSIKSINPINQSMQIIQFIYLLFSN